MKAKSFIYLLLIAMGAQSCIATNMHDNNDANIIEIVEYRMLIADGLASIEALERIRSGSEMSDNMELHEISIDLAIIAAWETSRSSDKANKFMARKFLSEAKRYHMKYPHMVELTIGSSEWKQSMSNQIVKAVAILDSVKEDEVQASVVERICEPNGDRDVKDTIRRIIVANGYLSIKMLEDIRSESDMSDTLELHEILIDQAVIAAWSNRNSVEEINQSMADNYLSEAKQYRMKYPRRVESTRVRSEMTDYMSNQIQKATVIINQAYR